MPRQVNRIPEFIDTLKGELRAAEVAAAEQIVESAKERVPVDPDAESHLRDAIHTREDEDGVWVIAGDRKHWYGHMVEHGTTHSAPHPFLIPAVEENTASFIEDVRSALRRSA